MKSIGIVIPCYNEQEYIEACLQSILQNDFPGRVEIKVIDGMSEDGTRDIIARFEEQYSNIRMIDNPKKTTPFALNIGIKALETDVVVILGAHSEIAPDFLTENEKVLDEHPDVWCSGGHCENIYSTRTARAIGVAMSSRFGVGDATFRTGGNDGLVDTVAFGAYRSEVFDKIGLFNELLTRNQDDEFNYRLTRAGGKIYYSSSIRYRYHVRASFNKLFKQYYQYGYWKVIVNKMHKTITTWRQVIPALFVIYLIVQSVALFLFPWAIYGVIILELYFLIALLLSFRKGAPPLRVFFSFLILHISYGLGYLHGMLSGEIPEKTSISR